MPFGKNPLSSSDQILPERISLYRRQTSFFDALENRGPHIFPTAGMIEILNDFQNGSRLTSDGGFEELRGHDGIPLPDQVELSDRGIQRRVAARIHRACQLAVVVVGRPGLDVEVACQGHDHSGFLEALRQVHGEGTSTTMAQERQPLDRMCRKNLAKSLLQAIDDGFGVTCMRPDDRMTRWGLGESVVAGAAKVEAGVGIERHQAEHEGIAGSRVVGDPLAVDPRRAVTFQVDVKPRRRRNRPVGEHHVAEGRALDDGALKAGGGGSPIEPRSDRRTSSSYSSQANGYGASPLSWEYHLLREISPMFAHEGSIGQMSFN